MLRDDLIGEPEVWAMMVARFPWVEVERGDIGDGLIHLEFAALRSGVEAAAAPKDVKAALPILSFVENLYSDARLHPDVLNAIDVSFVEDLYLSEEHQRDFAEGLLGPHTRARWDEVAGWHTAQ